MQPVRSNGLIVAESALLKRERIRRRTNPTPEAATQEVFQYYEMLYNSRRKQTTNGKLSTVAFETKQQKLNQAGVQETRGTSMTGGC